MNRALVEKFIAKNYSKRTRWNLTMVVVLGVCMVLALTPLLSVFGYVIAQGYPALNLKFFTELPAPVGEIGGGMGHAFLGTLILVGLASAIGVPWGICIGIYLSEYSQGRLGKWVRYAAEILASVPSIVIGLFVYAVLVKPMGHFSAHAGGAALAILMLPTVAKTTEVLLKLVPVSVREAGLALGIPRWKVILFIVVRGSRAGLVTGVMLSIARAAGETAPLLFTAFGNSFWQTSLNQPIASVPVQIYTYAISPYDDWHQKAWAGAFILIVFVFVVNLLARVIFARAR
jgi:phosphate transport system permease protein